LIAGGDLDMLSLEAVARGLVACNGRKRGGNSMAMPWRRNPPRLGLALGGGGARGGIHIGVLKVLEREGIAIGGVAGTSIGALIGAMYAVSRSATAIEHRLHEYLESDLFRKARFNFMAETSTETRFGILRRIASFIKKEFIITLALSRPYLISKEHLLENLGFFIPDVRIDDLDVPFAAVATDLETGEEVVIRRGSLLQAVYASCTYPGVVEAARWAGRLLVDGGVVSMVPVRAARQLGADVVVAVNAERCIGESIEGLSGIEILFRADDIMGAELTRYQTEDAEVLIHPGAGEDRWYDFQKMPQYVSMGEKAAHERIGEIRMALDEKTSSPVVLSVRRMLRGGRSRGRLR